MRFATVAIGGVERQKWGHYRGLWKRLRRQAKLQARRSGCEGWRVVLMPHFEVLEVVAAGLARPRMRGAGKSNQKRR